MSIHIGYPDLTNSRRHSLMKFIDKVDALSRIVSDPNGEQKENIAYLKRVDLFADQWDEYSTVDFPQRACEQILRFLPSVESLRERALMQFTEWRIDNPGKFKSKGESHIQLNRSLDEIVSAIAEASLAKKSRIKEILSVAAERAN